MHAAIILTSEETIRLVEDDVSEETEKLSSEIDKLIITIKSKTGQSYVPVMGNSDGLMYDICF